MYSSLRIHGKGFGMELHGIFVSVEVIALVEVYGKSVNHLGIDFRCNWDGLECSSIFPKCREWIKNSS